MIKQIAFGLALAACPIGAAAQQNVLAEQGSGAILRVLDRLTGDLGDLEMVNGAETAFGRIRIRMSECRFPADNPSSDAFAFVTVWDEKTDSAAFEGWMIASSPALSALDHPRYDVWVLRCINE